MIYARTSRSFVLDAQVLQFVPAPLRNSPWTPQGATWELQSRERSP
jgi:hypothetical protein